MSFMIWKNHEKILWKDSEDNEGDNIEEIIDLLTGELIEITIMEEVWEIAQQVYLGLKDRGKIVIGNSDVEKWFFSKKDEFVILKEKVNNIELWSEIMEFTFDNVYDCVKKERFGNNGYRYDGMMVKERGNV